MTAFKSDFLHEMEWRGFINQVSEPKEDLDDLAARGRLIAYIGFDCTAPSLHVGSMVQIMCLHWLQKTGNRPIALMGGGTTRVGDPSGKDETRKILTVEEIERNKDGIRQVFARFLDFDDSPRAAIMDDNAEWLTKLNWIEMLRDIGKHFSVNRMLAMDSVKLRLERNQEMSFIEFNYMLLQAYDFVVLNKRYDCRLQMGGSDQWGNITQGTELGRRMGTPQLFALTTPLITTASGEKMGKTAGGAVWLNADMKSPYEYWQFWRNTEDADVGRFLRLFTTLSHDEIVRLEALAGSEINEAKKVLATEATTLLHGPAAAHEALETAQRTFEQRGFADRLPSFTLSRDHLRAFQQPGLGVLIAFHAAGLVSSNGEARRQIKAGGLKVNDITVTDESLLLTVDDLNSQGVIKLSLGKKRHILLRPM